ncbi:MAG TPA: hypothetical protein VGD80_37385 [Kofleriaceae bacterium]
MRWLLATAVFGCAVFGCAVSGCAISGCAAGPTGGQQPARPVPPPSEAARPPAETAIALPGGASSLWWDAAAATLYLTDSNASALMAWTDAGGFQLASALPAGPAGVSLGGIVRRPDGSFVVASFGFGTEGGMFSVARGTATALTGLDPARRRVGLAQDSEGVLYSVYFTGMRGTVPSGGVASVAIAGTAATETEITSGFHKAVGVAATPTAVFVADQTDKAIFKVAVPGYAVSRLATVPAVDLLMLLPGGDLLTGGGPAIARITQRGEVSTLPGPVFEQVRGLAYDAQGKRLFVIDHSLTVGVPDKLRIVPLAE